MLLVFFFSLFYHADGRYLGQFLVRSGFPEIFVLALMKSLHSLALEVGAKKGGNSMWE
jgi:hypothetical protein